MEGDVTIYTDGSCTPNPGPGGWAAILRYGEYEKVLTGYSPATTNNRMELTAAVQALAALKRPCRVRLCTDSQYLKRGISEWLPRWRRNGWTRRDGGEAANLDLWQELSASAEKHRIDWAWTRGHSSHPENERADRLARESAQDGARAALEALEPLSMTHR